MHWQMLWIAAMAMGCGGGAAPARPSAAAAAPVAAVRTPEPEPQRDEREDFEAATPGSLPPGWTSVLASKDVAVTAEREATGMVLQIVSTTAGSAIIKRPLDLARYRGKRVLINVRGRLQKGGFLSETLVGLDVARPGPRGYADRPRTDQVFGDAWRDYRAVADIAADATGVDLVVTVKDSPKTQLDDIVLTVIGTAGAGDEPPRALAGRGLDNVVAFARLYGIVRYFHPSDEAAALDDARWASFLVHGVRAIESAPDATELAKRLAAMFAPLAPGATVQSEGTPAPEIAAIAGPAVHWAHSGLGLWPGSAYESERIGRDRQFRYTITTAIDPTLVRGKQLEVTLRGRAALRDGRGSAGLWIVQHTAEAKQGDHTEPEIQPAVGARWTTVRAEARIASDVRSVALGVQMTGDGEVWFDLPVVTADGKPIALPAWGPNHGDMTQAWKTDGKDHSTMAIGDRTCDRRACLHITTRTPPVDLRPWRGALAGGVVATVPLELATQDGKTLPRATAPLPPAETAPLVVTDRATRLADVIIAWNILEHFYPYFDVVHTDWMAELRQRLADAARDDGARAFHTTLRHLMHDLRDAHGSVWHPSEDITWSVPWLWDIVENKVAITHVAEACACDLAPGDVLTAIDGEPAERVFATAEALYAAATEQYERVQALRRLRTGPAGGHHTLTIERGGVTRDVTIALVDPSVELIEHRPQSGAEVAPGIRYVNLDQATQKEWEAILPDLARAKAVVCDVRGYPKFELSVSLAHFITRQVRSAQWHVPEPARPDREGMTFASSFWAIEPVQPHVRNVVFLTDARAVSAAETYMGIVEGNKLGPIVGAPTAGTNGDINPFTLPGGYNFWWTGLQVLKHDGSRHHGVGILPTVPATRTLAGVRAQRDEVLERGIAVAQQLAAGKLVR